VKVFLIPLDHSKSFFYAEDDADDATLPSNRVGWRGWIERSSQRVRAALRHPNGRFLRTLQRIWDWLQRRMHPDERLLLALRRAPLIEIYHQASIPAESVQADWRGYLRRRLWRHVGWLIFDGLLAPLSAFLWVLPGPNVIGYWFAYRAVLHVLILLGIRGVLRGQVETMFHPVVELELNGDHPGRPWLVEAAVKYELNGLHDFVARVAPGTAVVDMTARETEARTEIEVDQNQAGPADQPCDC
jgi:hypothetical protein